MRTLGAPWSIQNQTNLEKLEIVLTGVTKRVPRRLPGSILEFILNDFLNIIQQFGFMVSERGDREGPGKNREARGEEQGRSRTGRKARSTRK